MQRAIQGCSTLLDQSLVTFASLQEDLTIQQVETEVRELHRLMTNSGDGLDSHYHVVAG